MAVVNTVTVCTWTKLYGNDTLEDHSKKLVSRVQSQGIYTTSLVGRGCCIHVYRYYTRILRTHTTVCERKTGQQNKIFTWWEIIDRLSLKRATMTSVG